MSEQSYPTQYPTGPISNAEIGFESTVPPAGAQIPWIDSHHHTQTLSWNDRERIDLSGGVGVVMIAATYHWSPYRPVRPEDVRFLWDDALKRSHDFNRSHFFNTYLSIGVHTLARVDDVESVLEVMPEYCELDEVVAIGETGIEPVQATSKWDIPEQRNVIERQMEIAKAQDLPVIIHTPTAKKGSKSTMTKSKVEEGHNPTDRQLPAESAKLDATKMDVEIADDAGLPHEQVVIDHADETNVEYVMEETKCYLSFSIGVEWLRGVGPETVAAAIEEYGPERIMIDSDRNGCLYADDYGMKRAILDLLRQGVSPADVRRIAYENPKEVFGLAELP
jgi:predicted metal-dependent TIM-barrel fold hydrolase